MKIKIVMISGKANSGKDTMAATLKEMMELDNKKVLITHFADLVKYVCRTYFNWDGNKDEDGRSLLTYIGTDKVRAMYPEFWVKFIFQILMVFQDQWDYVIIPDLRMKNEYEYFLDSEFEVTTIRLNRLGFENALTDTQRAHISETQMDDYKFDYTVVVKEGIENLEYMTRHLYRKVFRGQN